MIITNRNAIYLLVVSTLLMIAFSCYMIVDWVEVAEYDELYSVDSCCSSPMPPYSLERVVMYVSIAFVTIVGTFWIIDNIRGR